MYEPLVPDDARPSDVTTECGKDTASRSRQPGDVIAQIHLPRDGSGEDQPVVVLRYANSGSEKYEKYMTSRSRVLGAIQVAIGIFAMILNIIGLCNVIRFQVPSEGFAMGAGIWGGIFFCLSGSFAIHSSKSPKRCPIVAHMVFAIIGTAAAFALIMMGLGTLGHSVNHHIHLSHVEMNDHIVKVNIAISVMLLICGLIELITCIWSSTLSCRVICCGGYPDQILVEPVAVPYSENGRPTCTVNVP